MAVGYDYELYVDGTRVFYSNSSFNIYCGVDQFADMSGSATGSYTYDEGQYAGWTTIQGSTTPEYAYQGQSPVSDVIQVRGKMYLYSIPASAPTGKTQLGTRTITKKMFGTREITKEVVNGVVVYEKQASLPTFTGTNLGGYVYGPYQFENGMTFAQWVASAYNTDGWVVNANNKIVLNGYLFLRKGSFTDVVSTDVVEALDYYIYSDN